MAPHTGKIEATLKGGMPLTHTVEGSTKDECDERVAEYLDGLDGMLDGTPTITVEEKPRFQIALLAALADQMYLMNAEGWSLDDIDKRIKTFDSAQGEQFVYDNYVKGIIEDLIERLNLDEPVEDVMP